MTHAGRKRSALYGSFLFNIRWGERKESRLLPQSNVSKERVGNECGANDETSEWKNGFPSSYPMAIKKRRKNDTKSDSRF
ncbi:MAG: hypothetical protein KAV87_22030 [Desulfobacteraceae bacterium]|nr:hypothetical protein [Desulfobacteraceae bacterium]